jgi:hypothetical protein
VAGEGEEDAAVLGVPSPEMEWWSAMAARQWQRCSLMGRFLELGEKREAGMGVVEEG